MTTFVFRHRYVGAVFLVVFIGISIAFNIISYFTPLFKGEAVQQARELVETRTYMSKMTMYWRWGEFVDQFGALIRKESPYMSRSDEDATFARRCDGPRTLLRTAYILAIVAAATGGICVLLALVGSVLPRRRFRWVLPTLALIFALITAGILSAPSVIVFNIWTNDRWCFNEFAFRDTPEFNTNNGASSSDWYNNGNWNPQNLPNNDRWNRYLFTNNVNANTTNILNKPFYDLLAPQMKTLYLNLPTNDVKVSFRQDVAVGRLGTVTVRNFVQSHGLRLIVASWISAIIGFVVYAAWFAVAVIYGRCCGDKDGEPFGRRF